MDSPTRVPTSNILSGRVVCWPNPVPRRNISTSKQTKCFKSASKELAYLQDCKPNSWTRTCHFRICSSGAMATSSFQSVGQIDADMATVR
jgi:hypothetical protein